MGRSTRPLTRPSVRSAIRLLILGSTCVLAPAPHAGAAPQPSQLVELAGQARTAMAAGRFDEAARLYARVVEALPDEPGMRLNLGMALSMSGRADQAIEHLEAAARLAPGMPAASLFLGMARLELGQPERAIAPLERFLEAQPDHLEARLMVADACLALQRLDGAVRHFRALTEYAARHPRAWYGLGRAYEGLAAKAFEAMQRAAPESHFTTLLVAETMAALGRDATAFRLFREVLEEHDLAEVHEALAMIYERRDHPDWAEVERERAQALPTTKCGPATESLECDFRAGRFESILRATEGLETGEALYWRSRAANQLARSAFARLAELPPSPEAVLLEVEVRRSHRQPPGESIDELKRAVAKWPEDRRLRLELVNTLFAAGETEDIRPLLDGLLADSPDSTELIVMSAETWLRLLQPKKAIPLLERALALEPGLTAAQVALGRAYMEAGETEKAIAPLEAALDSDTDGTVHYRLSRAYRQLGQAEKSREVRERFQQIERDLAERARSSEEEFKITAPDATREP